MYIQFIHVVYKIHLRSLYDVSHRLCRRFCNPNFFLPQLTYRILEKGKFCRSLHTAIGMILK